MSLRIAFLTVLLCGFLAVIPSTHSLRCYNKVCEDGDCVGITEGLVCGEGYDKCGTLTFTTSSSIEVLQINCTISDRDCNEEDLRVRLTAFLSSFDETLSEFSVSCCDGDMCNAPAERKSDEVNLHGEKKNSKEVKSIKEKIHKMISAGI
ncbi:uncharacterized protein LOC144640700 [Oculina patagonica]